MRAPDLDALDAALAGEPGADRGLVALVRDVRAEAPEPDPAFLAALDERVTAGFPHPEQGRRRLAGRRLAGPLVLAASVLAALVVVAVVIAPGDREADQVGDAARGGGSGPVVQEAPGPASSTEQRSDASGAPAAPSASAPSTAPPANARADRRVERAAQLTLTPAAGEVQAVADGVTRTTQELGGFVESSQVTTGRDGGSGSLRLRMPSARLATAIERLSALAPVGALSQSATDITGATGAGAERVSDARAERRALLRALGRATADREIAALRERLRLNRSRLAAARGALESLRRRARLSTVDVTVRGAAVAPNGGGAWTPRDALGDALRVLQVAAGVALVGAAVLAPMLLLVAVGVVTGRVATRRRREQALDAT